MVATGMFKLKTALLALVLLGCVGIAACADNSSPVVPELANFGQFLVSHQASNAELRKQATDLLKAIDTQAKTKKLPTDSQRVELKSLAKELLAKRSYFAARKLGDALNQVANDKSFGLLALHLRDAQRWLTWFFY